MVFKLNGRKNISIFGNVITLQRTLRNEFLGNNNLLKVPKIKYGYQIKIKSSISEINVACSNTYLPLRDCNGNRTHAHLVRKRTLNHLARLAKCLSCIVSIYLYGAFDCMLLSCHVRVSE